MRNLRSRLTHHTETYNYDDLPGNHSTFSLGYTIVPIRKHHTIHDNNCQICHSTASQSQANKVVAERRLARGGRLATVAALGRARRHSARLGSARSAHLRLEQQNRTEGCLPACQPAAWTPQCLRPTPVWPLEIPEFLCIRTFTVRIYDHMPQSLLFICTAGSFDV